MSNIFSILGLDNSRELLARSAMLIRIEFALERLGTPKNLTRQIMRRVEIAAGF